MADLTGKAALVTGGSRGIGAAIARRLARDGADVAITYSASPDKAEAVVKELEALGRRALAIHAPAEDAAAVTAAVDRTAAELGRLDILVNNAGVGQFALVDDFPLADFDRVMAVNVRAVFVAVQAAVKHLQAGGRVVTIGSVNGDTMPIQGGSVYAASKSAVQGLTRGFARDLGGRGITVNVVQPGPVDTDMNPKDGPFAEMLKAGMAIPEYAHVDEVAALVAYLVSEEARHVTGTAVTLDGGFNT